MKVKDLMLALAIGGCAFSCNDSVPSQEQKKEQQAPISEPSACYGLTDDKDTVLMQIVIVNNKASGDLVYNYWQKDKNSGNFEGEMSGDTLFAVYHFMSEGISSSRNLAFLKTPEGFREGYGNVDEKSGLPDFSDKSSIRFDSSITLIKMDCGKDSRGCMALFGTTWSILKNSCIRLSGEATRLDPIEVKDRGDSPAFVVFSDNQDQAELYLPQADSAMILTRTGKEGAHVWQKGDWQLIPWKGYVLKKGKQVIYGGL